MCVLGNGNVGKTTTPSAKLEVVGDISCARLHIQASAVTDTYFTGSGLLPKSTEVIFYARELTISTSAPNILNTGCQRRKY